MNLGCGNYETGAIRIDINPDKTGLNLIADAHHLPLRNKIINKTLCRSVLEHVEAPIKALLEMKRVTKGVIIIVVPNIIQIVRLVKVMLDPLHPVSSGTWHLQGWDSKLMKHLAIKAGLEVHSIEWQFEKPHKWGFICRKLLASHMTVTLKDESKICQYCLGMKKRYWCDPDFSYCPECDIEKKCKQ